MAVIDLFRGQYDFLSNFYPVEIEYSGVIFPSTEHAYQAAKTLDPLEHEVIKMAATPGKAKRLGRGVTLRDDWDVIKIDVMRELVKQKFTKYPDLEKKLLLTSDAELIEGNTWGDRFWGQCRGVGENWLGKILMEIRTSLMKH